MQIYSGNQFYAAPSPRRVASAASAPLQQRQFAAATQAPTVSGLGMVGAAQAIRPPFLNKPKFGFIACGVCPVCVAGMQAQKELGNIKNLREGKGEKDDVTVEVGAGARAIRAAGAETGADVGSKYIGNEDGTRIQRLSAADHTAFINAALPRHYEKPDATSYKVVANPEHSTKGLENGLYKKLVHGLEQIKHTESFTEDTPPHFQEERLDHLDSKIRAFGVYHHIAEGPKVRETGKTQPLLVGYASASTIHPHELFIPSIREMPKFEEIGAAAGGLMNMMGMAAQHKEFKSAFVVVEPWQHELKKYVGSLQKDYGFKVENLSETHKVPHHYRDAMHQMNFPQGTELYKIPLDKMHENLKAIPKPEEEPQKGKRDTALMETIKLPDPDKNLLEDKIGQIRRVYPSLSQITLLRASHPDYAGMQERKPKESKL